MKGNVKQTANQNGQKDQSETITLVMGINSGAPEEFVIFPLGQVTGSGMEPFTVDERSVESVRAFHQSKGVDTVIDYEHQTLTGEVAPAAGWVKDFFQGSGGLACKVDWTDRAKEFIKNREYRYFSPVVGLDKNRNLVSIQSIALTNLPRGHNLTPLVMKALEANTSKGGDASPGMEETETMLKEILKLLGLPENATEAQAIEAMTARIKMATSHEVMSALNLPLAATTQEVMSAINGLKTAQTAVVACTEIMSELGLAAAASKSEALATLRALKQTQAAGISVEEFTVMKNKLAQMDADGLVTEAMKAGKITAAQKDWATQYAKTDQAGFKMFVEKAPVVVVMKTVAGPGTGGGSGGGSAAAAGQDMTETDIEVMKLMGITPEDFKKYYKPVSIQ